MILLQQLGMHMMKMMVPLVAIDGVRSCIPDAHGLSDTSCSNLSLWLVTQFLPNRWCGYRLHGLQHGLSVQTGDALFATSHVVVALRRTEDDV